MLNPLVSVVSVANVVVPFLSTISMLLKGLPLQSKHLKVNGIIVPEVTEVFVYLIMCYTFVYAVMFGSQASTEL